MISDLVELYLRNAQQSPNKVAFRSSPPEFKETLTWSEVWNLASQVAHQILAHGLKPGDRVGILASSSWRWEVAQLASFLAGCSVVGIDFHESEQNISLLQTKAQLKLIFYDQAHWLQKWERATQAQLPNIWLREFEKISHTATDAMDSVSRVKSSDEATVIFTSGTTSTPKGISYTHEKMIAAVEAIVALYPEATQNGRTVCWLPLANLFQRMMNFCTVWACGEIYFVENPVDVMNHLPTASPTIFASVPRFYDKIYDSVFAQLRTFPLPVRGFLSIGIFLARLRLKWTRFPPTSPKKALYLLPWEYLFFRKVRRIFGTNIKYLISGSAPLNKQVQYFFSAIGLPILEAYGTSENTIPIAANNLKNGRIGSVGKPVIEGSVRLSPDGEVLVLNHGLFQGYLSVDSSQSFENGYYKTGDLGHFDDDGFLFLHGRKNAMFKTTTGKKVNVQEIESEFKKIPFIDQVVVIGEGRKLPVVLVTLDIAVFLKIYDIDIDQYWDREKGEITIYYQNEITKKLSAIAAELKGQVKPFGALVLGRRFSLERQEITANLKIRTSAISHSFSSWLDQIYLTLDEATDFKTLFIRESAYKLKPNATQAIGGASRYWNLINMLFEILALRARTRFTGNPSPVLHRRAGQVVRKALGSFKGPLQKIGQMMSYLAHDLPLEFREELAELTYQGEAIDSQVIKTVIETELKKPLPAIFSEWRDQPIATASIGQVHWARLVTGEEVAVKVLIPGVESALRTDLKILSWVIPALGNLLRFKSISEHFHELQELMISECDFTQEAEYQQQFRKIFRDDPVILVPKVFTNYCSGRVLVTEFIEGISFDEFKRTASEADRKRAAEAIWSFSSRSINRYALFHADPHPGNFLFTPDRRVAVFDFGFCKKWDPQFIAKWKRQVLAGMGDSVEAFAQASREVGVIHPNDPSFYERLLKDYHSIIFRPWMRDEDFRFSHDFVREYLSALLAAQISVPGLILPREFLSLSRLYFGNFSIMAELDIEANYHRLTIPYVQQPIQSDILDSN